MLEGSNGVVSDEEAMTILNTVSQSSTIWSVAYNLNTSHIGVVMGKKYDHVHEFQLEQ